MKNKVFVSKYYYFLFEGIWIFVCILIPIYFLAFIFSFDIVMTKIREMIFEFFIACIIFIGLRDFSTAHLFLYFSDDRVCIKQGLITGKVLGYSCYELKNLNIDFKTYLYYFEVIKIDLPSQTIRLNNVMFSKKKFQEIKDQILMT